jgi:hypothetical protein
MSSRLAGFKRSSQDHFEPQDDSDPTAQRRLRGQLEHIDYTAFAANREVIGAVLGQAANAANFQKLAVAAAQARALWIKAALTAAESGTPLDPRQSNQLSDLRANYEELTEAYEAIRRMVERGYISYATTPGH